MDVGCFPAVAGRAYARIFDWGRDCSRKAPTRVRGRAAKVAKGGLGVVNLGMDFVGWGRHKGRMKTYDRFKKRELILRDELAIDRTLLANKSTLLSFMQLSISLTIAGVSIIHFAMEEWFRSIGVLCVPTGLVVGILGWRRYWKMEAEI